MTKLILTSAQEAAFNAAAEAARDLGIPFFLNFGSDGFVSAFGYPRDNFRDATVSSGYVESGADAVRTFLSKLDDALAKPPTLIKPSEVVAAVKANVASNNMSGPALIDWLDTLPVKD